LQVAAARVLHVCDVEVEVNAKMLRRELAGHRIFTDNQPCWSGTGIPVLQVTDQSGIAQLSQRVSE
jgi:hypothetical protein